MPGWDPYRHPLMRKGDRITVRGYNGDSCIISGPGARDDWGPILAPGSKGLFEAPVRTNWGPGMHGQRFESWSPQRRDPVFTVHIINPINGSPALQSDPDLWHITYSRWRSMWSFDYENTIVYESVDGERHLKARLVKEPEPFATQQWEGGDPHLFPYGSIVMPTACELPYYVGATEKFVYEWEGNGDHHFKIPFYNPAQIMFWPRWYCTDRAAYQLPDFSWGWEEYGRGVQDEGKTVRVPRVGTLRVGENIDINTTPEEETIRAENDAPVGNRMGGTDFEYPVQPGCGAPPTEEHKDEWATVRMLNVTNPDGARVELDMDRWYSSPFGTPTVA